MCGSNPGQSQSDISRIQPDLSSELACPNTEEDNVDPFFLLDCENHSETHAEPLTTSDIRQNSARFLLQLREAKGLSQVAVDTVVEGCEQLVSECLHHVHMNIKSKIQDSEQLKMIDETFLHGIRPFDGLQNKPTGEVLCAKF